MPAAATPKTRKAPPSPSKGADLLDTVERLKAVADPLRLRFLMLLADAPRTVKEVAEDLGVPPTRLYYHLRILERHGLVEVADRRMISGIEERTYRAAAESLTVPPTLAASALYESGALRAVMDLVRSEIEVSVQDRPDLSMEVPGSPLQAFGVTDLELSDDDLPELLRMFQEMLKRFARQGRKRKRGGKEPFHLFYALYPVPVTVPASRSDGG